MTAENLGTLVIMRRFDFAIERVFDAWLDPVRASKILGHGSLCVTTEAGTAQIVRVDIHRLRPDREHCVDRLPRQLARLRSTPASADGRGLDRGAEIAFDHRAEAVEVERRL